MIVGAHWNRSGTTEIEVGPSALLTTKYGWPAGIDVEKTELEIADHSRRDWRRGWDLNPGTALRRSAVFKTAPFDRSGTPPRGHPMRVCGPPGTCRRAPRSAPRSAHAVPCTFCTPAAPRAACLAAQAGGDTLHDGFRLGTFGARYTRTLYPDLERPRHRIRPTLSRIHVDRISDGLAGFPFRRKEVDDDGVERAVVETHARCRCFAPRRSTARRPLGRSSGHRRPPRPW